MSFLMPSIYRMQAGDCRILNYNLTFLWASKIWIVPLLINFMRRYLLSLLLKEKRERWK